MGKKAKLPVPEPPEPGTATAEMRTTPRVWTLALAAHLALLAYMLAVRALIVADGGDFLGQLRGLAVWDCPSYLTIASEGYTAPNLAVLFPLYPAAIALFTLLLRDPHLSAYGVTLAAHVGGACLLYRLAQMDQSAPLARRAVFFSLVFPAAFVAVIPYSESLFLCAVLAAFYFFRSGRFTLAGLCAFLAASARLPGAALGPAFLLDLLRERRTRPIVAHSLLPVLAPCLGIVVFLAVNWRFYGDPFCFLTVQKTHFVRQIASPHVGARDAWYALLRGGADWWTVGLGELLGGVLAWGITVYAALRLRASYAVYCGLSAALFTFQSFWLCNLRYVYVFFPLYILLGRVSRRDWVYYTLAAVSLAGLAILSMQFSRGYWVT